MSLIKVSVEAGWNQKEKCKGQLVAELRMPTKAPDKSKKSGPVSSEEEEAARKLKLKRIKEITEQALAEVQLPLEQELLYKLYDSQGLPRPSGPEEPKASNKLVFRDKLVEEKQITTLPLNAVNQADNESKSTMVRALSKALKQMCPLYAMINSLCFWELSVGDEGVKGLVDFATKFKQGVWPGLMHLELVECGITAKGCEILRESLAENIPLKSLNLDFNTLGDHGITRLASGLRRNTNLTALRHELPRLLRLSPPARNEDLGDAGADSLGYCGATAACAEPLAEGCVRGSKIIDLNLRGNQLGMFISRGARPGPTVGSGIVPIICGIRDHLLAREQLAVNASSDPAFDQMLAEEHKARRTESGQLRAFGGPWAGFDLQVSGGEPEGREVHVSTGTLKRLDLSHNRILPDPPAAEIVIQRAMDAEGSLMVVADNAVELGAAQTLEGVYLRIDREIVRILEVLDGATDLCVLAADIYDSSRTIRLAEGGGARLDAAVGGCILVGSEVMGVEAVRGDLVTVQRGGYGMPSARYPAKTPVARLTTLIVERGACFSERSEHPRESKALRIGPLALLALMLPAVSPPLTDLRLDHNDIGPQAAEQLVDPARRLEVLTVSGREIPGRIFKELYKDGAGGKKKKGKKKK